MPEVVVPKLSLRTRQRYTPVSEISVSAPSRKGKEREVVREETIVEEDEEDGDAMEEDEEEEDPVPEITKYVEIPVFPSQLGPIIL